MSQFCAAFSSSPSAPRLGGSPKPRPGLRRNLRTHLRRGGSPRSLRLPAALAVVVLQLAGSACMQRGGGAPAEAAPAAAVDRPEDLPRCGCKTPCAAHVEKAPCACKKANLGTTES